MTKYGIADIGSNTIVLIIYEMEDQIPKMLFYRSTPAHLIQYVKDGTMSQEGINKAFEILSEYARVLDEMNISIRYAGITEPGRVSNRSELLNRLQKTSFTVRALSGEEEAECEYIGSKVFYPDIKEGLAFDVGGGSSELIAFSEGKMTDAVSLPVGCVRMASLPKDTDTCEKMLKEYTDGNPSFAVQSDTLIGIGGTIRAAGILSSALFHTGHTLPVAILENVYKGLTEGKEEYISALRQTIDPSRQPFLAPGIHIILDICRLFGTETILVSETNVREGFLLKYVIGAE